MPPAHARGPLCRVALGRGGWLLLEQETQERVRERTQNRSQSFHSLILEVTSQRFCHILSVRSESLGPAHPWRGEDFTKASMPKGRHHGAAFLKFYTWAQINTQSFLNAYLPRLLCIFWAPFVSSLCFWSTVWLNRVHKPVSFLTSTHDDQRPNFSHHLGCKFLESRNSVLYFVMLWKPYAVNKCIIVVEWISVIHQKELYMGLWHPSSTYGSAFNYFDLGYIATS